MRKRENEFSSNAATIGHEDSDPRFVIALARGLHLLRAFRRGDAGLGNQDLALRTGLPKSTVSRLTYTLTRLGYLDYNTDTGRYSLSVSVLALGFSALGGLAVRDIARPMMQELADKIGCSVALGAPDKKTMVYIEHCKGKSPLHIGMEIGAHIRMTTSAMGRAYLASLPDVERERLLDELCPQDENGQTIREGVAHCVEQFHANGYVTSIGEWKSEINSVGVPLILHGSQPYALNCGGSALILRETEIDSVGRDLVELANKIHRALGNK